MSRQGSPCKKYDTTVIKRKHWKHIIAAHEKMVKNNKDSSKEHIYAYDVAATLNAKFKMDKSRQSYALIWNGHTAYHDLPV